MEIVNGARNMTVAQLREWILTIDDSELIAQELVQKGAMHGLQQLKALGVTETNLTALLDSLERMGSMIATECRRRGLPVVDQPGSN